MTLLPCPFCGGEPEFERLGDRRQSCIVRCGNCGAKHECGDEGDRCGTGWNTRHTAKKDQPAFWRYRWTFSGTSRPDVIRPNTAPPIQIIGYGWPPEPLYTGEQL